MSKGQFNNPFLEGSKTLGTCWNLISRSKVMGSLGLQTTGTLYSWFGEAVHGISFTVYVPE